ncbi:hypothetical protein SynRS9907_00781 [Synechococcus sp. RS9907]|nr:hypothetical protein SynRS9907_00781 [Synechococcus sp. RS9907]
MADLMDARSKQEANTAQGSGKERLTRKQHQLQKLQATGFQTKS